jgi:hypothetical protein
MPHRDQNLAQEEDDYDLYLFWPSLSSRDDSSGDPPSSPLYGVRLLYYFLPGLS